MNDYYLLLFIITSTMIHWKLFQSIMGYCFQLIGSGWLTLYYTVFNIFKIEKDFIRNDLKKTTEKERNSHFQHSNINIIANATFIIQFYYYYIFFVFFFLYENIAKQHNKNLFMHRYLAFGHAIGNFNESRTWILYMDSRTANTCKMSYDMCNVRICKAKICIM